MACASFLEEPLVVHTRPVIDMNDEQFFQFCLVNDTLQIERTAQGDLLIMAPGGGSSSSGGTKLVGIFCHWAESEGSGQVFGPSAGFILRNGAMRAPDVAWVRSERLAALTDEQWQKFLPLCPDFVLELRSATNRLARLREKMEEYRGNGAALGWLLNPERRQVHIYRPGAPVEILDHPATLSGEPLLRGLVLDVPQVWAAMERKRPTAGAA